MEMSEAKPKRAPRESVRGNGTRSAAKPVEPPEFARTVVPETATAAVALSIAAATEPAAEPSPAATEVAGKPTAAVEDSWVDSWAAWTEAQSALARGFEAI